MSIEQSVDNTNCQERNFAVNDLNIAARHWHTGAGKPVIAVHGWLDNAASFDHLAPLLPNYEVLALDLAGNGLSSPRSAHGAYNIWDDLLDIVAVADSMGWQRFNLLGHSRGAIVSFLLAAAMPERVDKAVFLDGMLPFGTDVAESPKQMRQYLLDQVSNRSRSPRVYQTQQEALDKRCSKNGLSADECLPLVQRGMLTLADGSCTWRHDNRIHGASVMKFTEAHTDAFVEALERPALLLAASDGFGGWQEMLDRMAARPGVDVRTLDGGHHMHMSFAAVQQVARSINQWL